MLLHGEGSDKCPANRPIPLRRLTPPYLRFSTDNKKSPFAANLEPSDGLEPSTPSLPSSKDAGTAGTGVPSRPRKPRKRKESPESK